MTLHGFYSAEAEAEYGYFIYTLKDGSEVKVTGVTLDKEGLGYKWEDKRYVGEVVKYVRSLNRSSRVAGFFRTN